MISRLLADLRRKTVGRKTVPLSKIDDRDLSLIVHFAFLAILGRLADPTGLEAYKGHLRNGMSIEEFKAILLGSEEARGQPALETDGKTTKICIMGKNQSLTNELWNKRLAEVQPEAPPTRRSPTPFVHSGQYDVSAIASIYKAKHFIERLLDNITSQTIFSHSELIIVDANSPEGEVDIIKRYQEKFQNIVYRRINYRIGIYDAWNIGVELSRGKYVTNTNADDLRREDSFEIQVNALDKSGADVVYQNFFYTLDPALSFEQVARVGFVSDVPHIAASNLIRFNAPHNAPMWRRDLHSDVGLFDTSFKSAGDWEFWLRCLTHGKLFHRIETPHVVYYHNPEGISTRSDTRGIEEGRWIAMRYRHLLVDAL
jgi:GT2 family glycosyltransferase